MRHHVAVMVLMLGLSACGDNFAPRDKSAVYDPERKELTMPYPCPDWSQSQTRNYLNQNHSNFGCAVNTNAALQLEDPADLHRGHGDNRPHPEVRERYLRRYFAGEIPEPLNPVQSSDSGGSQ